MCGRLLEAARRSSRIELALCLGFEKQSEVLESQVVWWFVLERDILGAFLTKVCP